jgi:hypothetical protein
VVPEDAPQVLADLVAGRRTPVEADRDAIVREEPGEGLDTRFVKLGGDPRYASTSR